VSETPDATRRFAVVTGGADGIGWTIAEALRAEGREVVLADVNGARAAERCADDPGLAAIELDVADGDAVAHAFTRLEAERGPLGLLVNNAGVRHVATLDELTDADWARVMSVNLSGAFHCLKAAGRQLRTAGGGAIVNVVSVAAERGVPGRGAYAAAKAALASLTRTAAVEWAERGVRVNAVGPGYVDTPLLRDPIERGELDEGAIVARIPSKRIGTPREIADVVCFLASDRASYVNGQTIWIDGGFLVDYGVGTR